VLAQDTASVAPLWRAREQVAGAPAGRTVERCQQLLFERNADAGHDHEIGVGDRRRVGVRTAPHMADAERGLAPRRRADAVRGVEHVGGDRHTGFQAGGEGEDRDAHCQNIPDCCHFRHYSNRRFGRKECASNRRRRTMTARTVTEDDPLEDFTPRKIICDGAGKVVHVAGNGPAVIVMTEMPGISPHVARFARWVRDAGFTVYMPSLFGRDGAVPMAEEGAAIFRRACMSAEFRAFAANQSSPVTQWLRALARLAHTECGGPGVGAIGMCFTGNFALSMMLESSVLAPVLSQPSLPLDKPADLDIAPEELAAVRERLDRENLTVMGYRFAGDRICRAERFAALSAALGDRFIARTLPDCAAHPDPPPFFRQHVPYPHSVVTAHLIDEAGQPTIAARDEILAFFRQRLAGDGRL
jgi:dienelactone hydrolase